MTTRRDFVGLVAGGLLGLGSASFAQRGTATARIGYLSILKPPAEFTDAFVRGLRELGYVEGTNLVIEYRWSDGDDARLPKLAADLVEIDARGPAEFDGAFRAMADHRVDAVVVAADPILNANVKAVADRAIRQRLPTASGWDFAESGGLLGYGASISELYGRAPRFVDKILKGAKPADLPVEQPTKFELVINLKTAKALGLTIPQSLLLRADEVIQ